MSYYILVCVLFGSAIFFQNYFMKYRIWRIFTEYKMCVLNFCTNFVCNTLYSDNSSVRYCHNCTYCTFSRKLLVSSHSSVTLKFSAKSFHIYIYIYILHFTIILPVVAHFFHAEKDGQTHLKKLIVDFRRFELLIYLVCQLQHRHDTQPVATQK